MSEKIKTNIMELRNDWLIWTGKCPVCGSEILFSKDCHIIVNNYSLGTVEIKDMLGLVRGCTNPNCIWSKIKVKS